MNDFLSPLCKGGRFIVDESNAGTLEQIVHYSNHSPAFFGDLNKGICLCGPMGVGKSILMKAMAKILWRVEDVSGVTMPTFSMDNIVRLAGYYQQKDVGDSIFNEISARYLKGRKNHRCCNDIGRETKEVMYMGNREDVGARYIFDRYELFQDYGTITHFTTNFEDADRFSERYGNLNYDRMKEMCNFIFMTGESKRR